jgi:hypothetical protein
MNSFDLILQTRQIKLKRVNHVTEMCALQILPK